VFVRGFGGSLKPCFERTPSARDDGIDLADRTRANGGATHAHKLLRAQLGEGTVELGKVYFPRGREFCVNGAFELIPVGGMARDESEEWINR